MKKSILKSILLTILLILTLVVLALAQWENVTNMPTPRGATAVAALDGKIYVIGGTDAPETSALKTVEIYDPVTNTWETGPELPSGAMLSTAEIVDGKIYVIGGQHFDDDTSINGVFEFDPAENTWTYHGGVLPEGIMIHASSVVDDKIYLSGGQSHGSEPAEHTFYSFDPSTMTYENLTIMPSPRGLHTSEVVNDKIYIMGGAFMTQGVKPIYVYDPLLQEWSLAGEIPGPKVFLGSGTYHHYIYIFAGTTDVWSGIGSPGIWRYNSCTKTWEDLGHDYLDFVVHQRQCSYTFENGDTYIYAFGGNTDAYYYDLAGPKVSDKVYRYKISTPTVIAGGAVSGTWTCENSPYIIEADIWVEKGSSLVIEPCVELYFKDEVHFDVHGQLIAEGNEEHNILFTAEDIYKPWNGLRIYDNNETGDSTKLVYCTIEHAYAKGNSNEDKSGGGIAIIRSDYAMVKHCTIRKNKTNSEKDAGGAGIAIGECSPLITQNLIYQNNALFEGHGGGIMLFQSESEVSNNIIYDNWAWGGGGISVIDYIDWSDKTPTIINNTIVDNYGNDHGGGICFALGQANIINNIIYFNDSDGDGKQVYIGYNPNSQFHYNDIQGGEAAIAHPGIIVIDHYENNIDEDPMFIWYPFNLWLNGKYVESHSPCIGTGTEGIEINGQWIYAPKVDYKDDPRMGSPNVNVDMGAIEYPWTVNAEEARLNKFALSVSPNPATDIVHINFNLDAHGPVSIEVFDLSGKKIALIADSYFKQGSHDFNWNTTNLEQGIYLIKLKINNAFTTTKLIVSKE